RILNGGEPVEVRYKEMLDKKNREIRDLQRQLFDKNRDTASQEKPTEKIQDIQQVSSDDAKANDQLKNDYEKLKTDYEDLKRASENQGQEKVKSTPNPKSEQQVILLKNENETLSESLKQKEKEFEKLKNKFDREKEL